MSDTTKTALSAGEIEALGALLSSVDKYCLPLECIGDYANCDGGWDGCTTRVEPEVHALICGAVNALPRLLSMLTPVEPQELAEAVEELQDATRRWGDSANGTPMFALTLKSGLTLLRAVRAPRLTREQREAISTIINSDDPVCHYCEGEGNRYADGKAHYYSEHAPTIPCPECYGVGRIPELTANDMKGLLRAAFAADLAGELGEVEG